MREFARLFRSYIGINLFQGYRVLDFPWFLRLFSPRWNMITQVTSDGTFTTSGNPSKETGDGSPGVLIHIQSYPEKDASDSNFERAPVGGSSSTGIYAQSPPSANEPESNSTEDAPYDSIVFDELLNVSAGHSSLRGSFPMLAAHCGWLWNIFESPYSIPFWLLLMSAPISAAVVGALHMHSCPGAVNLAIMIFAMGVSYSAALIIKICFILIKTLEKKESWKPLLKNFFGITAVITIGLCVTESAYFWQMESSQEPSSSRYCDPQFTSYAFWWNCFMWFGIVILFFCQG